MKISTDLIDALMMVSFIILVLIGTTPFDDPNNKTITMSIFGLVAVSSVAMRIIKMRKGQNTTQH